MPRLTNGARTGCTILVVDDQEDSLDSSRTLLEREGHRVLTCTGGEEALAVLAQEDVQLLVVDYSMPGMNGADLVKAIRASDPYVQIILQTGYAGVKPPLALLAELDIQGYHNKTDGPDGLLMWVAVGLKAHRLIRRLRERERMQAELVANVSHEFRTPLNVIGGYTEMLMEEACGPMPPEALGILRAVAETNRSLAELVDNALHYARTDAGVTQLTSDRVATATLAQELLRLGSVLCEEKPVRFAVEVDGAPASFQSDSVKLRTILRNLVVNAAKFTRSGEVRLEIAAQGGSLVFRVQDTGPGIPADKLDAVFEPFRQLDGSSTRTHGGVGLGLALSRRLARLLGGRLELESRVGAGSVFTLTLPPPPAPAAAASERGEGGKREAVAWHAG